MGEGEDGNPGQAVTTDELRAFLRARIAAYKVPKAVRVLRELPQTASGKVSRPALAELLPLTQEV